MASWLIPAVLGVGALVTIEYWMPDPLANLHAEQARLVNDEIDLECHKLATTPDLFRDCTLELRRWRERDSGAEVLS